LFIFSTIKTFSIELHNSVYYYYNNKKES